MTSRMASTILNRANSIKRPKLPQLRKTIQTTFGNDGGAYEMNEYIHKNFFHGENYQSILKCLDDGYNVMTDQLEYMQDYCNLLQDLINSLKSYSNKWKSKLKHQSTLASYNTTKQSQIETINSSIKLADLYQKRCEAIEQVISLFRKQIDRLYPSERFGTVHKHYRTDSMKKKFKDAYVSLSKSMKIRDEIRDDKDKADKSLLNAQIECQNLQLDETTSQSKLAKANDRLEKKQRESQNINEQLIQAEENVQREENIYHEKAMEIYQKCREYEGERLDLIRKILIQFIHAIHSTDHSTEQDILYEKLLAKIESQQNTQADLDFWAEIYHVIEHTSKMNSSVEIIESNTTESTTRKSITTTDVNNNREIIEEEQSIIEKSSTNMKSKQKKKRNTTTEPTSPDIN